MRRTIIAIALPILLHERGKPRRERRPVSAVHRENSVKHAVTMILAATCVLILLGNEALAHGGGLDRHGCHRETATGGYHCHRGTTPPPPPDSDTPGESEGESGKQKDDKVDWTLIGGVAGGVLILWVLVKCAEENKYAERTGLQIVPDFDETGGTVALEYLLDRSQSVGVRSTTPWNESPAGRHVGAYWRLKF